MNEHELDLYDEDEDGLTPEEYDRAERRGQSAAQYMADKRIAERGAE